MFCAQERPFGTAAAVQPFGAGVPAVSPFDAAAPAVSPAVTETQVTLAGAGSTKTVGKSAEPDAGFTVAAQPGDDTTPNNYIPLNDTNAFCANVRVTLGGLDPSSPEKKETIALPDRVGLTVVITRDRAVLYDLQVEVTNPLACVAAAVLDVPRLAGLLLLEEEHKVGEVRYLPQVMEKEQADAAYQQAAASETHSATLGAVEESSFAIKLDKVPPGATATFGVKLLQSGGLRELEAVVADGSAPATCLADVSVLPTYAPLDGRGVPFELCVLFDGEAFEAVLPSEAVLRHEAEQSYGGGGGGFGFGFFGGGGRAPRVDIASLVCLHPELAERDGSFRALRWKHCTGPARGTLLRARLSRRRDDGGLTAGLAALGLAPPPPSAAAGGELLLVESVDVFAGAYYSPADGTKHDASLLELRLPAHVPGVLPNAAPHQLTVIVDTSGSTGRAAGAGAGGGNVLDASTRLLRAILRALPEHIGAMRARGALNGTPVALRLWHFDGQTTRAAEVAVGVDAGADAAAIAAVDQKLQALRPGGVTNYDSWAAQLRATVGEHASALHSVLLVTDGGATQREQFVQSIEAIAAGCPGFFQVDCLGYGPWLDARTVSFLAAATGGEAIMVEELGGEEMRTKVVGLLARSMLRAASAFTLRVAGKLLAAQPAPGERPPAACLVSDLHALASPGAASAAPPVFELAVMPGSTLKLLVLHPTGHQPQLHLCGRLARPFVAPAVGGAPGDKWELVGSPSAPAPPAGLDKLSQPLTVQALRHLPLVEPAFAEPASLCLPAETAKERVAVCLRISLAGQIVAPSVTKGCAVAQLQTTLTPVPEHCRPEPPALLETFTKAGFGHSVHFQDEDHVPGMGMGKGKGGGGPFAKGGWGPPQPRGCFMPASAAAPLAFGAPQMQPAGGPFGAPPPQQAAARSAGAKPQSEKKKKINQAGLFGGGGQPSGPPTLSRWIEVSRGGLSAASLPRDPPPGPRAAPLLRLTREALQTQLKAVATQLREAPDNSMPMATAPAHATAAAAIDAVSAAQSLLPPAAALLPPPLLALRLIECCCDLLPATAGLAVARVAWLKGGAAPGAVTAPISAAVAVALDAVTTAGVGGAQPAWPWLAAPAPPAAAAPPATAPSPASVPAEPATTAAPTAPAVPADLHGEVVPVAPPPANELAARAAQEALFTPAVRRDIYKVLLSPFAPATPPVTPSASASGAGVEAGLAVSRLPPGACAFGMRSAPLQPGFVLADDNELTAAIGMMGRTDAQSYALLAAFESFLMRCTPSWDLAQAAGLSVEFAIAFGSELGPRLGIETRIRTGKLRPDELATLRAPPWNAFVDQNALSMFQGA